MVEKNKFVKANEFDPLDPIYEGLQDEITNKTAFELLQSLAGSIQTLQGVQLPTETEIVGDSITVDRYYTKITTAGTLSSVNVAIINGGDAILDGGVIEIVLPTGTTVVNSTDINGIQTYSGSNIVTTDNYVLTLIRNGGKWQETTNANVFVDTIKQIANLAQSTANTANATANNALSGLNGKFDKTGGVLDGDIDVKSQGSNEQHFSNKYRFLDNNGVPFAQIEAVKYTGLHQLWLTLLSHNLRFEFNQNGQIACVGGANPFSPLTPAPIPTNNAGLGQIVNVTGNSYTVPSGKWWCFINNIDGGGGYFIYVANGVYSAGTTFNRIAGGALNGFAIKLKEG